MQQITETIYAQLRGREFARNGRDYNERLAKAINFFAKQEKPVKLVGFWGVGPKEKAGRSDFMVCDFFDKLNAKVKTIYAPGLEFTFIISTNHGEQNHYPSKLISSYARSMESLFAKHKFLSIDLNLLWKKYDITLDKISEEVKAKPKSWWENIEKAAALEAAAHKRSKNSDTLFSAKRYYLMRQIEKPMLETEFSHTIFHTFSDASWDVVFPDLPTLYFWAGKRGTSEPPWFTID